MNAINIILSAKSKVMCNIPIKVSAHTSLNSSKGVIRSRDLEGVGEDEMMENLSSQGVSVVKRIHIRRNNEFVPTNTFILTFCKPLLPDSIKAGYLKIPVVHSIPNPLWCFKCHRYGQMSVLVDSRRPNNISSRLAIVTTLLLTSVMKEWTSVKRVF